MLPLSAFCGILLRKKGKKQTKKFFFVNFSFKIATFFILTYLSTVVALAILFTDAHEPHCHKNAGNKTKCLRRSLKKTGGENVSFKVALHKNN